MRASQRVHELQRHIGKKVIMIDYVREHGNICNVFSFSDIPLAVECAMGKDYFLQNLLKIILIRFMLALILRKKRVFSAIKKAEKLGLQNCFYSREY